MSRSGFRVITTCSPRNFDLVKSRGADEVYDYRNIDECVKNIRASVGDDLQYAYGCIGSSECPLVRTQEVSVTSVLTILDISGLFSRLVQ